MDHEVTLPYNAKDILRKPHEVMDNITSVKILQRERPCTSVCERRATTLKTAISNRAEGDTLL